MRNGVTFWTEGGSNLGMGHVMRCINVARAVSELDTPVHFLVNDDKTVAKKLNNAGFYHMTYPISGMHASRIVDEVVVIDTKKDVTRQIKRLKENGRKVILVDNMISCEFADAVIMPTPVYNNKNVSPFIHAGSDYVILGENFVNEERRRALKWSLPLKVLVTMGGADPFHLTNQVVEALNGMDGIEVTVVIGPAFRPDARLREFMEQEREGFTFLHNVSDMAPVMAGSHIAFTAVGTTINELSFMGVPSVLIANYDDDGEDLKTFSELGVSTSLGFYKNVSASDIRGAVTSFMEDPLAWENSAERCAGLMDGRGAARIASIIESMLEAPQIARQIKNLFYGAYNA